MNTTGFLDSCFEKGIKLHRSRDVQQQQQQQNEQKPQIFDIQCNNEQKYCKEILDRENKSSELRDVRQLRCIKKNAHKGTGLSWPDKLLSLMILVVMIFGVVLGYYVPNTGVRLNKAHITNVSLPVAIGLWLMMYPVLCKVQYETLGQIFRLKETWLQVTFSLIANWIISPLVMLGLAWATLPDQPLIRNGVILVGLARCIAMVLIWNQMAGGDGNLCAILVAINSILQTVLYAPFALLYLQVISRQYLDSKLHLSFWDVFKSVLIFLGVPLVAAVITRYSLMKIMGRRRYEQKFLPLIGPLAMIALLWTIFAMFTTQAYQIVTEIRSVLRVIVPLVIYFAITWSTAFAVSFKRGFKYDQAVTQSFTAASNNFELAIAIAVGTFGINSMEALAATVGPLVEVPVLLSLVYVARFAKRKFKLQ